MKRIIMSVARGARERLRDAGLDIRSVRGREHWRAGVEILWHTLDDRTERVRICHIEGFDKRALFLVRDAQDYIQSHYLKGSYYAEDELKLIQQYYRGGTFLDIGANVGNHTVFAGVVLEAPRIIACEPYRPAHRILRCNTALNDLEDRVEHMAIGLSDEAGTGNMVGRATNMGATRIDTAGGDIPIRVGDELFANEDISFIKLDVEGMEMSVLHGLKKTIRRCRPDILVEVENKNLDEFETLCRDFGYTVQESWRPYVSITYFLVSADER